MCVLVLGIVLSVCVSKVSGESVSSESVSGETEDGGADLGGTKWQDMIFSMDGEVYQLPFAYSGIKDTWTFNLSDYGYDKGYVLNPGDKVVGTIQLKNNQYSKVRCIVGFMNTGEEVKDILDTINGIDKTTADILEKLRSIQTKGDKNDDKRTQLELEQKEADIEQTNAQTKATEESVKVQKAEVSSGEGHHEETEAEKKTRGKSPAEEQREKAESDKQQKNYSRLEQKQHEKTRVGSTKRSEKLAKSQNKSV